MPKGVYRLISCTKCGKQIKANVFNRHFTISCGRVEERSVRVAWNKGMSKETDHRIADLAIKVSKSLTGKKRHPMSDKQKQNLSALQSERLNRGYADGSREQSGGFCEWFEVDGIKVQGSWEFRAGKILSKWKHEGKILEWSRCPHRITYIIDGKSRIYSPDFLVKRVDGSEYILEIKGRQSIIDDVKWKATKDASFELIIWRLKEIQDNERE